jgi:hypothetical protein
MCCDQGYGRAARKGALSWRGLVIPLALLAVSLISTGDATGQPTSNQIPMLTRQVTKYSDYERKLVDAFRIKDKAAIDSLVSEDFELVTSNPQAPQVMRPDWIAQNIAVPAPFTIDLMIVHEYGDVDVVSFNAKSKLAGKKSVMIVDVWRQVGDKPVLMTRYALDWSGRRNRGA